MYLILPLLFFTAGVFVPGFQGQGTTTTQTPTLPDDCGPGYRDWFHYKDSCYYIYELYASWQRAEESCFEKGAHLVSVHSEEENEYIFGKLKARWTRMTDFWTGLNAIGNDAAFQWSDGSVVDYTTFNFDSNTPGEEKCMLFNRDQRDWSTKNCARQMGAICKRAFTDPKITLTPPSTTTAPGNCPEGWQRSGNKCFGVFGTASEDRLNWTEAWNKCKAMGSNHDLASFHSDYEQAFLTRALTKDTPKLWFGLNKLGDFRESNRWSDNSRFDYENWAPGMPSSSRYNCFEMLSAGIDAGKWSTANCVERNAYVCQRSPDVSAVTSAPDIDGCPQGGFTKFGKNCYKVFVDSATWNVAESSCTKSGSHLLSLFSIYEQAFVRTLLDPTTSIPSFWLGLSHSQNNRFIWTDGWPIYFTNWGLNEPGPTQYNRCVYMNPKTMEWGVQLCSQRTAYVCKFSLEKPPVVPEVKYDSCPNHVIDWIDVGLHHCYFVQVSDQQSNAKKLPTMSDASIICSQNGSQLASFHSEHEVNLIEPFLKNAKGAIWLGLLRKRLGGFEWIDNSPVDYTRWAEGEPTNYTDYNCVNMDPIDLKWSTRSCWNNFGYICMIPKVIRTTTTRQPITTTTPQYPDCGPGFKEWKLYNGYCYLFNSPQNMNWQTAESFCFNKSAHLLSIGSEEENEFVFKQVSSIYRSPYTLWIGMNAIGSDASFEWSDGTPLNYVSVIADLKGRERCVAFFRRSRDWIVSHCSESMGALCKRRFGDEPITITKPVTTVSPGNCPQGWLRAGNKCFGLFGTQLEDRLTWTSAWEKCRSMGSNSDLASLHSSFDHAVLIQSFSDTTPPIWIGLNRQGKVNIPYGWSDDTKLNFPNWASGMPSNAQLKCGEMITTGAEAGRWISRNCEVKNAYICQKSPDESVVTNAPDLTGCPGEGYLKNGRNCYKVSQTSATWTEAEAECRESGSHLVSIMNIYEQALVHTLVQSAKNKEGFWLGLSHGQDERFKWTDGWPVYFTNWAKNEPGLYNSSLCVYINPEFMEWAVGECETRKQFICKYSNDPKPTLPDINSEPCPSHVKDWIDIGLDHCYFIQKQTETFGFRPTKTFGEASLSCSQNDTEVASFHSQHELDLLYPYFKDSRTSIWTGLLRKHHGGFEWSDNSPVDFENWNEGQPDNKTANLCVEMSSTTTKWATQTCSVIGGFFCKIQKVLKTTTVIPTTTTAQTTIGTTLSVPGCGPGYRTWKLYKGSCYLFETSQNMDWYAAEKYCFEHSAHLTSIHSEDENQFIFQQEQGFNRFYKTVWIGMNAIGSDAAFRWSDGTAVEYSSISTDVKGRERCVSFVKENSDWSANLCSAKMGAVCKRRFGDEPITITKPTPTVSPGNCPQGWLRAGNKCYALFGTAPEERQTWTSAWENCRKMGPSHDLASFHSSYELAVLIKNFSESTPTPWIGLNRIGDYGVPYGWSDNTKVDFTNWDKSMPNNAQMKCAEMVTSSTFVGKWANNNCEIKNAYICQQIPDISVVTTAPDRTGCPDKGYLKHQGKCYKLSSTPATWKEAESECQKSRSHLASIMSNYELALVQTLIQPTGINGGVWLGLSHAQTDRFKWTDGWPVYYTNWGKDQPGMYNSSLCVYLNQEFMEWSVEDCSEKKYYICKYSNEVLPTIPPPNTMVCPSLAQTWTDVGLDHCYFIQKTVTKFDSKAKSFGEASFICSQNGSQIASFHSQHELDMLLPNFQDSLFQFWTGLVKKYHGGFEWSDNSPVAFTNWDEGQPDDQNGLLCVEMDKISGKWRTQSCGSSMGYICMIKKVSVSVSTVSPTSKEGITTKFVPVSTATKGRTTSYIVPVTVSTISSTRKAEMTSNIVTQATSARTSGSTAGITTVKEVNQAGGLGGGAIAGIVILAVVSVLILTLGGYIYFRKKTGKPNTGFFNIHSLFVSQEKTDGGAPPLITT